MRLPAPCEFSRSVVLAAPIEEVYAFHGNPHNISRISPPWQSVEIKKGSTAPRAGEAFVIEVRLFGLLPLRWRGIWRETVSPYRLVDEALSSPFASWRHRHLFEPLGMDRTRMTDHVSYRFPGGWLGRLFGETLGRVQFALMFGDRQRRTARWFMNRSGG